MTSDTVFSLVTVMKGMFSRVFVRVLFSIMVAGETLVMLFMMVGSIPVIGIIITVSVTAGRTVLGVFRCGLRIPQNPVRFPQCLISPGIGRCNPPLGRLLLFQ